MAAFRRTEAHVQGWDIAPEQLQICRSSLDGSEILLGSGQFGKVRVALHASNVVRRRLASCTCFTLG